MRYQEKKLYEHPGRVIIKTLTRVDYHLDKYRRLAGAVEVLEQSDADDVFFIKTRRQSHIDVPLPDFARKLVPTHLHIVQSERWDRRSLSGELRIELPGLPVQISAQMSLHDTATGCEQILDFNLVVAMPLFASKLESLLAEDFRKKFAADTAASHSAFVAYVD